MALLRRQLGLDETTCAVMRVWEKEFVPQFPYARLEGVKKNQLIIEVQSSVQFQEMTLRRRELVKKINQYFGGAKAVKDIKVVLRQS